MYYLKTLTVATNPRCFRVCGAGKAQSVRCRVIGWEAGFSFPARARQVYLLYSVQTGSVVHPACNPIDITGYFAPGYCGRNVKLTTHRHSVPRSHTVELDLHFSIRLHGAGLHSHRSYCKVCHLRRMLLRPRALQSLL
jgi:hypothetical protein